VADGLTPIRVRATRAGAKLLSAVIVNSLGMLSRTRGCFALYMLRILLGAIIRIIAMELAIFSVHFVPCLIVFAFAERWPFRLPKTKAHDVLLTIGSCAPRSKISRSRRDLERESILAAHSTKVPESGRNSDFGLPKLVLTPF
jgi:hypothetical protein